MIGPRTIHLVERRGWVKHWDAAVAAGLPPHGTTPMYWFRRERNFGDVMAPDIVRIIGGIRPRWVSRNYQGKVMSVGSLLQDLREGDTIWGTGLILDRYLPCPEGVRFLAVRGPLTRSRVRADVPEVYGDPACLLPIFHQTPVKRTHEIGVVPHYADAAFVTIDDPKVRVINVLRPWREVVDAIRGCETIVSSSLHGLVVAEAYGIPAAWVTVGDGVIGGGFKFRDYYLGSGREIAEATPWDAGLAAALARVAPPPEFDTAGLLKAAQGLKEATRPGSAHEAFAPSRQAASAAGPTPMPAARGEVPTRLALHIGGALVQLAPDDAADFRALALDQLSLKRLQKQREQVYEQVVLAAPTWAHLRSRSAPMRLLGATRHLEIQILDDGPTSLRTAPLRAVMPHLESVDWSEASPNGQRVRVTTTAPVLVADLVTAFTGEDAGPLRMPLRLGLSGRAVEEFAAGNPHARYEGLDDVVVTPDRVLSAIDVLLTESPSEQDCGLAGTTAELGIPIVAVAGVSTEPAAAAPAIAVDPALLLPPVDAWAVNPGGFARQRLKLQGPGRCQPDPAGVVIVDDQGEELVRIAWGHPLAYSQIQRLRPLWSLSLATDLGGSARDQASLIVQLAAAGVPLVIPEIPAGVRRRLGEPLAAVLEANAEHLEGGPLLRDVVSVRMRRTALQEHGPGPRARRLAAISGHYVTPLPTISVLLVSRRPQFLAQAMAQIAAQTWDSIEVVLGLHGDHFSQEAVQEALAAGRSPTTVVRIPETAPFGEALNRASAAATGTLLAKWDDDDLYGRDHLWDMALALDYSGADLVGKGAEYVLVDDLSALVRLNSHWSEGFTAWVAGGTLLMRRQLLEELGGWHPVPHAVDHALIRQILDAGGSVYRTHGLGYILRRHGHGHTWDPGLGHFLQGRSRQWRFTSELRRLVLDMEVPASMATTVLARQ